MSKITFVDSTLSAEERHTAIKQFLAENKLAVVNFTKIDGSKRTMQCTLSSDLIPPSTATSTSTKKATHETMSVWCTEAGAWRSFKTMNVLSIETEPTTYVATVEADPEDPEGSVLTFPPEMLARVGWQAGDTLEWNDLGNGNYSLTKKE